MRQLHNDNLSVLTTTYNASAGRFGNFLLRYSGTAQTGQTVSLANCGNVMVNVKGDSKVNVDVELLSQAANLYGGYIEASSTIGAAFAFSVVIPAGYWFDKKNVFDIASGEKTFFKMDYPNMTSALIASGTVVLYGKPQAGIQSYYHKILGAPISVSGSIQKTDSIVEQNIISAYLKDPTSLIDTMQMSKDGNLIFDGDVVSELVWSNWIHNVEVASTLMALEFAENGNIASANSGVLSYNLHFTGPGVLPLYYSAIDYSPAKLAQTSRG
jgi:hypothetical protein